MAELFIWPAAYLVAGVLIAVAYNWRPSGAPLWVWTVVVSLILAYIVVGTFQLTWEHFAVPSGRHHR